ncbi:uncharacterized protein LOC115445227 isoform X2 [Manduca sexta]|uniref:Gustatory receptor n=1 Tax=Manduca sexta TaxID=7130 RepID=A0A921Z7N9_MANSE|nr:uncharacterized protein LOC115445227 isoform X2 [Manduca sexta]KAG6452759.1 hypothetical protein O3G_MSEX007781 [Manduca sexta]
MNNSQQNTYKTFTPLIWILKIFAINSNVEDARMTLSSIIRIIVTASILGTLIIISFYFKVKYIFSDIIISIKLTDAIQMVYDYCQYIVDLYFVYKYGRRISAEYFKQYDKLDKVLGMNSYQTIKKRIIKLILLFTGLWIVSSSFDMFAWVLSYGWRTPLVYSVAYIYLYIKIATMLDFTSHVIHAEVRLKIIGDLVQVHYNDTECSTDLIGDCIFNKNWLYANENSSTSKRKLHPDPIKSLPHPGHHEVKSLTRCYLMLTEQVVYVNSMYGLRILLNSLSLLIDMVRYTNIGVRIVLKSQDTPYDSGYLPAVSNLIRLLTCAAIFVNLADHCENVYRKRERIITIIDHLLIYKSPSKKIQ